MFQLLYHIFSSIMALNMLMSILFYHIFSNLMALNILMSTGHIADFSLGHDSLVVIGNNIFPFRKL
jgi:hypothetical protein